MHPTQAKSGLEWATRTVVTKKGGPFPRFPVELSGFREVHAPFLKGRRTHGCVQCCVQEIGVKPRFGLSGEHP